MKRIFIVGATGYIGSVVAEKFLARGDIVLGLTRSDQKAAILQTRGIKPVRGSMEEVHTLLEYAQTADATILATEAQTGDSQLAAIRSLLSALQSGQALIHTSGTGVLSDDAEGEPSGAIYAEDTPFTVLPRQQPRVVLERMVLDAPARSGVRAMVMRPPLIYGRGASRQIPNLLRVAQETGTTRFVGRGLNRWSTVHLDDLADLFVLVVERGQNGQLYHAVSGEENFRSITESIGCAFWPVRPAASWTLEEADAFSTTTRLFTLLWRATVARSVRAPKHWIGRHRVPVCSTTSNAVPTCKPDLPMRSGFSTASVGKMKAAKSRSEDRNRVLSFKCLC